LRLYFKDFCKTCRPDSTEVHNLCPACVAEMGPDTINQWREVTQIMNTHDYPSK
jgi:predicted amidophosphoribosyltransferase